MKTGFLVLAVLVCGVVAGVMAEPQDVFAQTSSGSTFDRTLETLRQSVARLVKENQTINANNAAARLKIKALQGDLRTLQAEADRLEVKRTAEAQKAQNPSGGVDALKAQVAQVDGVLKQARDNTAAELAQFKGLEKEEAALQQKADALSAEIASMNSLGASSEAAAKELASLKTEQESLQKQLVLVVDRVEAAKSKWQAVNAEVTAGPEQLETLRSEYDALVKAVPQTEAELTKMGVQLTDTQADLDKLRSEDYSDTRAGRLESELKDMAERNRKLEAEIQTTAKTTEERSKRLAEDQEKLRKEYAAKQEELSLRHADLKVELDALRKQMVDLDKKKSMLEAAVYPAP
jgi:chromosome segregation ATPase